MQQVSRPKNLEAAKGDYLVIHIDRRDAPAAAHPCAGVRMSQVVRPPGAMLTRALRKWPPKQRLDLGEGQRDLIGLARSQMLLQRAIGRRVSLALRRATRRAVIAVRREGGAAGAAFATAQRRFDGLPNLLHGVAPALHVRCLVGVAVVLGLPATEHVVDRKG